MNKEVAVTPNFVQKSQFPIINFFNYSLFMKLPYAEPYRIKMVEEIRQSTKEEREQWLKNADYIYSI